MRTDRTEAATRQRRIAADNARLPGEQSRTTHSSTVHQIRPAATLAPAATGVPMGQSVTVPIEGQLSAVMALVAHAGAARPPTPAG
jgi:hypothetical protein